VCVVDQAHIASPNGVGQTEVKTDYKKVTVHICLAETLIYSTHLSFRNPTRATRINILNKNFLKNSLQ